MKKHVDVILRWAFCMALIVIGYTTLWLIGISIANLFLGELGD